MKWKIVAYIILLLPVAINYFAWITLLRLGQSILEPVMDQPETVHALILMSGANMYGIIGTIVLAYWFYFRACEKMKPSVTTP